MKIELKEHVGYEFLSVQQNNSNINNLLESNIQTYIDDNSLMVDIEAIHSKLTRNFTYYTPECLKDSVPYWTNPYERPVIMHHNEKDGRIIGRVKSVEYKETGTRNNLPALIFTANIGDEEGKKGIKNGTLSTVSISAIAHDLRCSICGTNIAEQGMCCHEKGEEYDGELCYWIVNKMEPKEVSYVIVPSDIYAHNLRAYNINKNNQGEVKKIMENYNPFTDLAESIKTSLLKNQPQESQIVDEEVKNNDDVANNTTSKEEITPETSTEENNNKETNKEEETKKDTEEVNNEEKEAVKEETKEENLEEKNNEKIEALKLELEKINKELSDLKSENEKINKKFKEEKKLRESAESELILLRKEKKQRLVENVNKLRENLSLPKEDEAILMESSEENLSLSIKQLKEFQELHNNKLGYNLIESPVKVSDDKDNTNKENKKINNVKEFSSYSNINLEEEILNTINLCW